MALLKICCSMQHWRSPSSFVNNEHTTWSLACYYLRDAIQALAQCGHMSIVLGKQDPEKNWRLLGLVAFFNYRYIGLVFVFLSVTTTSHLQIFKSWYLNVSWSFLTVPSAVDGPASWPRNSILLADWHLALVEQLAHNHHSFPFPLRGIFNGGSRKKRGAP